VNRFPRRAPGRWLAAPILTVALVVVACGSTSQTPAAPATAAGSSAPPSAIATASPSAEVLSTESATPGVAGETSSPSPSPTVGTSPNSPSSSPSAAPSAAPPSPPRDDWKTYASKVVHMRYEYPAGSGWTLLKGKPNSGLDTLLGPADVNLEFTRFAAHGVTLDGLVHRIRTDPHNDSGFHIDAVRTVTMGGVTGRQMLIHATEAQEFQIDTPAMHAKKRHWILTFILRGSFFYEISLTANKGHEAADLAFANRFVASVVLI
jgi:hypothetical protein